jgi:hypothetical protein
MVAVIARIETPQTEQRTRPARYLFTLRLRPGARGLRIIVDDAYEYSPPDIVMARVPKDKISGRGAYQFFSGLRARTFDSLTITPALPVAFLFARLLRPIALLGLPARSSSRRLSALTAAITLSKTRRKNAFQKGL